MIKLFNKLTESLSVIDDTGKVSHIMRDSKEMIEADNVLRYCLHLKSSLDREHLKTILVNEDSTEFINYICEQAWNMAYPLFWGEPPKMGRPGGGRWNFFGHGDVDKGVYYMTEYVKQNESFWKKTIMSQCIVSTLFTLRESALQGTVSSYRMAVQISEKGYSYIRKNYCDSDGNYKKSVSDNHEKESRLGSDFNRLFKGFYPKIKGELRGYWTEENGKLRYKTSDAAYLSYLYQQRGDIKWIIKRVEHKYKETGIKEYFDRIDEVTNLAGKPEETYSKVDIIMLQYQFERDFNYSMVKEMMCLLITQNLKRERQIRKFKSLTNNTDAERYETLIKEYENRNEIIQDMPRKLLAMAFRLPNVFSRNLYLKLVLDAYQAAEYEDNYFKCKENPSEAAMHKRGRIFVGLEHDSKWRELCGKFFSLMSDLVFPVYERCFFLTYREAFRLMYGEEKGWIGDGISKLEDYVEKNERAIRCGGIDEAELEKMIDGWNECHSAYFEKKEFERVASIYTESRNGDVCEMDLKEMVNFCDKFEAAEIRKIGFEKVEAAWNEFKLGERSREEFEKVVAVWKEFITVKNNQEELKMVEAAWNEFTSGIKKEEFQKVEATWNEFRIGEMTKAGVEKAETAWAEFKSSVENKKGLQKVEDLWKIFRLGMINKEEKEKATDVYNRVKREILHGIVFAEKDWQKEWENLKPIEQREYNLLMRTILNELPEINDLPRKRKFGADYFGIEEDRVLYDKFLDGHLKAMRIR